jgi:hypothetical protein
MKKHIRLVIFCVIVFMLIAAFAAIAEYKSTKTAAEAAVVEHLMVEENGAVDIDCDHSRQKMWECTVIVDDKEVVLRVELGVAQVH